MVVDYIKKQNKLSKVQELKKNEKAFQENKYYQMLERIEDETSKDKVRREIERF